MFLEVDDGRAHYIVETNTEKRGECNVMIVRTDKNAKVTFS